MQDRCGGEGKSEDIWWLGEEKHGNEGDLGSRFSRTPTFCLTSKESGLDHLE